MLMQNSMIGELMDRIKSEFKKGYSATVHIVRGVENLVIASSAVVCAVYNVYGLRIQPDIAPFELYVRALATAVFGIIGAYKVAVVLKAIGEKE